MDFLFWVLIGVTVITIYAFWIRPLLAKTPALATLFQTEDTCLAAFKAKFAGIKQRLLHAAIIGASAIVGVYDEVAPKLTGINVTPITSHIPDWSWPVISIGAVLMLDYFRKLADQRHEDELAKKD